MRNKLKLLKAQQLPILKFYDQNSQILSNASVYTKMSFNKDIYSYIKQLKHAASKASFAYLTSNQTYVADSIFVIKKNLKSFVWFHQQYNDQKSYDVYINPKIKELIGPKQYLKQRCLSFPYIQFTTQRHKQIFAEYTSEKREETIQNMFGFKAIVYQHCIDHLLGKKLIDWQVSRGKFNIVNEMNGMMPKTAFILNEYSYRVKDALSKRKKDQILQLSKQEQTMKNSYQTKIKQQLQKQIMELYQKYNPKNKLGSR